MSLKQAIIIKKYQFYRYKDNSEVSDLTTEPIGCVASILLTNHIAIGQRNVAVVEVKSEPC